MTPDEIRAMEPGPELDALVATKVMGWVLGSFPQNGLMIEAWWEKGRRIPDDPAVALRHERDGQEAFTPSTDIADAMRSVEIIREKHDAAFGMFESKSVCRAEFRVGRRVWAPEMPHTGYESEMWMLPMPWPDTFTPEPLPVVICKAILVLKAALLALREGE